MVSAERRALLEGMDSITAISESHFRAKETGQLSFFGNVEGLEEEIRLPSFTSLDPREKLEWERELLGLYLSDHPLSAYRPRLKKAITHYTGQLMEAEHQIQVVVGGMVTFAQYHHQEWQGNGLCDARRYPGHRSNWSFSPRPGPNQKS